MFYYSKDKELTPAILAKFISKFTIEVLPTLKKWDDYYNGKHKILNKAYSDTTKECNHIVTNYCKIITDTYNGYICGKPITYTSNNNIEDVQEVLNYNDTAAEDTQFCKNALVYGVAYELQWLDRFSQTRYKQVNPLSCFTISDNTLDSELLYFIRWYEETAIFEDTKSYIVELYDYLTVKRYRCTSLGNQLDFIDERLHYFGEVPVSVFNLSDNKDNIFNSIISLNDAYNELQSSEIDDFNAWVDAYLVLKGVDADAEDIAAMKENRALIIPNDAAAEWLTKNANDTQIVNMLDNIKKNIFKVTACPDMADETFLAQSGTALAYKLVGFENLASSIVTNFTKALQRRIELICNVLQLKASEAIWRDININFVRNLPVNLTELIQLINTLKGTVSDKTLLAQLPFIKDVEAEIDAVNQQKAANMALYAFGEHSHTEDAEEVE